MTLKQLKAKYLREGAKLGYKRALNEADNFNFSKTDNLQFFIDHIIGELDDLAEEARACGNDIQALRNGNEMKQRKRLRAFLSKLSSTVTRIKGDARTDGYI